VTDAVTSPLYCVDAFTAEPFTGNPAAICLLDEPLPEPRMQAVAAELNLSETAFVVAGDGGETGEYELRWFTPTQEVELCGHATLASAHVLFETGRARHETIRFRTRWRGVLSAALEGDGIALDFPVAMSRAAAAPPGLVEALGASPAAVGSNDLHHVVELADATAVRSLTPDFVALAAVDGVEAVAVTARADEDGIDFVSRYFAPTAGINEDPVTGAAHCALTPFWSERLGRSELVGFQASKRGGTVRCRLESDRVVLGGHAVTVTRGDLQA
jgi:PhzF family phenazine biosynthesis protein